MAVSSDSRIGKHAMQPLSFGLNITKKSAERVPRPNAFASWSAPDDDVSDEDSNEAGQDIGGIEISTFDEDESKPPPTERPQPKTTEPKKPIGPVRARPGLELDTPLPVSQSGPGSEQPIPDEFDYDAHYDTTSSAAMKARKKVAAKAEAETRTPKYMKDMAAAATIRQRDQVRAKDKLLQKEREDEGDEFKDKDQFVTAAYRQQQEESQQAEDAERKREEEEAKGAAGQGMQQFYRGLLTKDEQQHRELVESFKNGAHPVAVDEQKQRDQVEAELAQRLNQKGGNVHINEQGEVTDKRQLLTAGLNVVAKSKSATNNSSSRPLSGLSSHTADPGRGFGGRDQRQAMRERQSRMIQDQIETAEKRAADEEAEELRKRERSAKSQKTADEVSSARERYLQRKKEAGAAKSKGDSI